MIIIIDFGSQTTHLISRRISEIGVKNVIVEPEKAIEKIEELKPSGLIFSGGPASVYTKNSPTIDNKVFALGLPILGICYGQQLIVHLLDGEVKQGVVKEFGPAEFFAERTSLFNHILVDHFQVWMSHGDEVKKLPKGFVGIGRTNDNKIGAVANEKRKIYGVQFHPEVQHTSFGTEILKNFLNICSEEAENTQIDIQGIIESIKEIVGNKKVVLGLSGGTDSFVAGALIAKAVDKNLIPVYVDSGLMRNNAKNNVEVLFPKLFKIKPKVINAREKFLQKLKNITDPEQKRKVIGELYVRIFEKVAAEEKGVVFLGQGTTYADFIHSKSTKHSALIKSHHNVGGLPKEMKLKLLEPVRYFYTDQVRFIGKQLGLPEGIIFQQPFPGPGFAVRMLGAVTKERLLKITQADLIVTEEVEKAGLEREIFQSFAILTGAKSTGIKGDGRFYGEVVAIRAYTTADRMTADWAKIPYPVLQKISTRIVNEVPEVSRVVYDITTKPPATMEWE